MLAPGDFLTNPVSQPATATPQAAIVATPPAPNTEHPQAEPSERRSFLMILLNALGAVHT